MDSPLSIRLLYEQVGKKEFKEGLIDLVFIKAIFPNFALDEAKHVQIPNTENNVLKSYMFEDSESVENVIISKGITCIEGGSFEYCTNLKNIVIPEGVTHVEDEVFWNCENLHKLVFPKSVTYIGFNVIGSKYLSSLTIPKQFEPEVKYYWDINNQHCWDIDNPEDCQKIEITYI